MEAPAFQSAWHLHTNANIYKHRIHNWICLFLFCRPSPSFSHDPPMRQDWGSHFHQYTVAVSNYTSKHTEVLGQRAPRKRNMDRDGLQELKGGVKRLEAWYSNRFRCLTPTASRLDSQCCLLAKDRGWERGREGEEAIQRRGTEEKDESVKKKKSELKKHAGTWQWRERGLHWDWVGEH